MAWLNLYTTAPQATSIYTTVRDQALALKSPAEPRTLTQLTADVCTDALSAALSGELPARSAALQARVGVGTPTSTSTSPSTSASPSTRTSGAVAGSGFGADPNNAFTRIRPTVTVTVPALTLLGVTNEPATLEGYGPIDPDTARLLAGQSNTWFRMLTDPKSGAPLALDSTTYRPSKSMKRFLAYRDGTCRFPGCNRAARHCDIDHTTAFAFGGPTECENLSHLCPKHHRLKHQTTWQARQIGNGVLEWTSPGGHSYVTQPEVLLTAPDPPPRSAPMQPRNALPSEPTQSQPRNALPPPNPDDPPPF